MGRETIIYNGIKYHRYPESPRRQLRVYYWCHTNWKKAPKALHRQIWEDNYGAISKGHFIHHKDKNPLNNSIENLECVPAGEHSKLHCSTKEHKELARKNLVKYAQPKAIVWHKSEAGREWHKLHARDGWDKDKREKRQFKTNCAVCNKEIIGFFKRKKFCSTNCNAKFLRWQRKSI